MLKTKNSKMSAVDGESLPQLIYIYICIHTQPSIFWGSNCKGTIKAWVVKIVIVWDFGPFPGVYLIFSPAIASI